jgi:SNF2 family DNA or RNA helicase
MNDIKLLPTLVELWNHQKLAVTKAIHQRDYALFMDMGTGKTATTVNILRHHYTKEKRVMRTLILAPVVVVENWKREFKVHSKIPQDLILTLTASGKKRAKDFEPISNARKNAVVISNFESLNMADLYKLFVQWQPEVIVIDESQRIKNPKAKRTKLAIALGDMAKHRYILSGTPILNDAMDVFAQYRFLDGGETFGKNFFEFRARYFEDRNAGMPAQRYFPNWQPRAGAYQEFNRLLYLKAMRVLKKDCLDLPPVVRKTIAVELTPQQRKNYEEMKKDFVTYLDDKACVANLALTKALRLLQIASGFFKDTEDEKAIHYDNSNRIEALKELLEMITPNEKVIVWACFRENYQAIADLLNEGKNPIEYRLLVGGMTEKDRLKSIEDFQTDPKVRVLVANQSAGGVGVNLTAASSMIYFSRNFSLEADMQSEARNHRGGSEVHDKITRIDLVAPGTIDEVVLDALLRKENLAANILAYKERFK